MLREIKNVKDKRSKVIIEHPDFGYVIFSEPTERQRQILEDYKALKLDKSEG